LGKKLSTYLSVVLEPSGGDSGNGVLNLRLSGLVGAGHGDGFLEGVEEVGVDIFLQIHSFLW